MPLCTEKQACTGAHHRPGISSISKFIWALAWTHPVFSPNFKKLGKPKKKAKYTQVYAQELVGEIEVVTAAKRCVQLLNMFYETNMGAVLLACVRQF